MVGRSLGRVREFRDRVIRGMRETRRELSRLEVVGAGTPQGRSP